VFKEVFNTTQLQRSAIQFMISPLNNSFLYNSMINISKLTQLESSSVEVYTSTLHVDISILMLVMLLGN